MGGCNGKLVVHLMEWVNAIKHRFTLLTQRNSFMLSQYCIVEPQFSDYHLFLLIYVPQNLSFVYTYLNL